jgi:Rrf2 family cysteine metabolism transcriptional repressor
MKISYKGDYALKAILELAPHYQTGTVLPLTEIAVRNDIPLQFLEQIMLILKGAGFIDSRRGIGGGFFLKKNPKDIAMGEIVRLIDGDIEPIACAKKNAEACCAEIETCVFREIWLKVTKCITDVVDTVTFADLMHRKKDLKQQSMGYLYNI